MGGGELQKDTGTCLKGVWLVSREFRNRRKKTGGVCGNKVLKGCRLAPSAKGQMAWITRQEGRPEKGANR